MRDEWIKRVNSKLDQYDASMAELDRKLDKNNSDTLSILVDNKRNAIISFASMVIDETKPVTKDSSIVSLSCTKSMRRLSVQMV